MNTRTSFTKIPCKECSWSYTGKVSRSPKIRKSEHLRNVEHCKAISNVAKHASTYDHVIDLTSTYDHVVNSKLINSGSHRTRKTLGSWHTAGTNSDVNNSQLLLKQYTILTKKNA